MKKRAFTLIELLVVISIIALLVSILLPSLRRAKLLAMDTLCSSNQKGVGMLVAMYVQDDGTYPWAWAGADYQTWDTVMAHTLGYTEPFKLFDCPRSAEEVVNVDLAREKLTTLGRRAYGINFYISGSPASQYWKPLNVSNMRKPAETLLLTDTTMWFCGSGVYFAIFDPTYILYQRHDDNANVQFIDYHIERVEKDNIGMEELYQDYNSGS